MGSSTAAMAAPLQDLKVSGRILLEKNLFIWSLGVDTDLMAYN